MGPGDLEVSREAREIKSNGGQGRLNGCLGKGYMAVTLGSVIWPNWKSLEINYV
jgi:hypothetical protein